MTLSVELFTYSVLLFSGIGPFYGARPRITHPKRHRTTTEAQRREPRVHSEYLEGPEVSESDVVVIEEES